MPWNLTLTWVLDPISIPQAYMTITLPTESSLPSPAHLLIGISLNIQCSNIRDTLIFEIMTFFQRAWQLLQCFRVDHM